jgi:uncharacterized protein YdhG (YjbR/CyaY superfamily)
MSPPSTPAAEAVDAYMSRVPPKYRAALQQLRKTIRASAPDAEEVLSYHMPAFRQHGMLVYYGAFKDHCSFFVGSARVRRQFAAESKSFEAGKGTLQFTPDRPLPTPLVKRIVRARVAENLARISK